MSDRKLIGRVSATEKYPSSCDDFQFWLSDDAILSPFDIVRVENKTDDSVTYGVVQDILHITDGTGHLSNYVSSDFGNVDTTPMTRRLSLSYAKVSVIHNTKENFMPVFEGSPVYTADSNDIEIALGLDNIDEKTAIPAGLMKASNNVAVPIKYNGDFLIGPEGAHMNISGISGLATKTSYVMFLLKAIQHKYKDDVAIIVMNVKGDDLLHVHQPNEKITPAQREEWDTLGVPCEPFENVKYLYPFRKQKDKLYANTALPTEDLAEQYSEKRASNFIYTFEHDISKVDMLFANVDDPNYTIESILNYIDYGQEFRDVSSWDEFKDKLKDFCTKGSGKNNEAELAKLKEQIAQNEAEIRGLVTTLTKLAGTPTEEYVVKQIDELHEKGEALKKRLADMEALTARHALADYEFEILKDVLYSFHSQIDTMTVEQKRNALRMVVKKVVWDGENAHVYLMTDPDDDPELPEPPSSGGVVGGPDFVDEKSPSGEYSE